MDTDVLTALITVSGGLLLAGASYWFTKQRERQADWRKEKLEHYKDFVASLSGVISGETSSEGQIIFANACNRLNLVAPQSVIEALQKFQQEIKITNTDKSQKRHDECMSGLFYEIRRDLNISPADDRNTFHAGLWASGVKSNK